MFKFIHAADIHLDSPLRGLEQYEGAPIQEIRDAARRALSNLVDLAIQQQVAFVLIAGDLYDGDWRDYNTGLFFTNEVRRLREADIPVFLISGNHDAANRMTRTLRLPDNVTFFSAERPESVILPDWDVAIHGQSFATAAVYDDLSQNYPPAKSGFFNIGLLHTCATGSEGHDRYAPCSIEGLKSKGYDYWALGHIHLRETLSENPFIAFSGNIQGRHIRETGPKGCLLATVHDDRSLETEFRELDVLRWDRAIVDVSHCRGLDDVLDAVSAELEQRLSPAGGRLLAVRVELMGTTDAHRQLHASQSHLQNEIRSIGNDIGRGDMWIEKLKIKTCEVAENATLAGVPDDAMGTIEALFTAARNHQSAIEELGFQLDDVTKRLPADLKESIRVNDPQWIAEILDAAEPLLRSRLSGQGGDA